MVFCYYWEKQLEHDAEWQMKLSVKERAVNDGQTGGGQLLLSSRQLEFVGNANHLLSYLILSYFDFSRKPELRVFILNHLIFKCWLNFFFKIVKIKQISLMGRQTPSQVCNLGIIALLVNKMLAQDPVLARSIKMFPRTNTHQEQDHINPTQPHLHP